MRTRLQWTSILLSLFVLAWGGTASAAIPQSERDALIALYNGTNGDSWHNNTNWKDAGGDFNPPGTECTWYGVACDAAHTTVLRISMNGNNMSGQLPPELGDLLNLTFLWLSFNPLGGTLPPEIGNLTDLRTLVMAGAGLTGEIPVEYAGLISLDYLDFYGNRLVGPIPDGLGYLPIRDLRLLVNNLTGPIPPSFANATNLQTLLLSGNNLDGDISVLCNLDRLSTLNLGSNNFSGEIPACLGDFPLVSLNLAGNNFDPGPVPEWLMFMPQLRFAVLAGTNRTGQIPPWIGGLTALEELWLSGNQLTGPIPPEIGAIAALKVLFLADNQLSGPLPPEIGNLNNLRRIGVWGNMLSGEIPYDITQLEYLYDHDLFLFWNAVHTTDPDILDFLGQITPGWQSTQTLAPDDVAVGEVTANSAEITWTPILYTGNQGGYRVLVGESGGPYTEAGMTANKLASSLVVTGLDDGTSYSFVVQSVTYPHASNNNTVVSEYSWEVSATTLSLNRPPVVEAGPDQEVGEGVPASFAGSFDDPDEGDTHTIHWDFGDGDFATGTLTPQHPFADDGVYTVTLTVTDDSGESGSDTLTVTVSNLAPAVGPITAPVDPVQVGAWITAEALFTDAGILDTHTALWDWGDSTTSSGIVTESGGSGSVTGEHPYTTPGVYTVTLTVTDNDDDSGTAFYQYVVVYDPDGGFVTGGGWIDSPAGAYAPDPSLTGKANFGFVSKYQKGTTVPTGETEFRFRAADLDFHSTSYQWLVVAGARAMYKGDGQINAEGAYGFMLSAIDGALPGGGGEDTFRIKIWDKTNDEVVYDNQIGEDDDAPPNTVLGGGSIVIHN